MTRTARPSTRARVAGAATLVLGGALLAACGGSAEGETAGSAGPARDGAVAVENCGQQVRLGAPVTRLFANDGNIVSLALAAGAHDQLTAVSSIQRDADVLALAYGAEAVDDLDVVAEKYPSLENVLAADPELVLAGWGYGFDESTGLTPDVLADRGVAAYLLSETCRQEDGDRGTMDPWTALTTDLANVGRLTGNEETTRAAVADIEERRAALEAAPRAAETPTAFLFDSGTDAIFTSGSYGAPQAILDAAGARNATADVADTWTEVGWETLNAADPDIIFFVDYPGQTYAQKVAALRANPASRSLEAVRQGRFVNLPYALWTSGPLNVDAAEWVRRALEHFGLQPASGTTPGLDLTRLEDLPGNDWLS